MKSLIAVMVSAAIMVMLASTVVIAQEPATCAEVYTVQNGDWLSKIAEKYYGDALGYERLVTDTNTQAQTDPAFTPITDANVIEPGWPLCITGTTERQATMEPTTPGSNIVTGLTGIDWRLVSANGQPALVDTPVTATFGPDGRLSGTSGCNNYTTAYTVDGSSLTIAPAIASTMMACPDPIMQQELQYMAALGAAVSFELQGDSLMLKDAAGNVVATFSAMKPVELAGSAWNVISYNNGKEAVVSVIIGTNLTATFGVDGRLTGSAGCNNYTTDYKIDGQTIAIGPAAATMMECPEPPGIMEQELQYLAALTTAATYKINLNRLEMRTSAGSLVASFEMMAPAASTESQMPAAEGADVTGTVTYRQRIALPADAMVKVQLQDTSLADAPAMVMGEQLIPTNGQQVPIPFAVTYNPADIQDNHTYTLSVRIEDNGGKLLFINTSAIPVITRGNPTTDIEVIVDPV